MLCKSHQGKEQGGRSGGDGGKIERKLSEVDTRAPTEIKRELVRFGVDCEQEGKLSGLLEEDQWPFIHSSRQTIFTINNKVNFNILFKLFLVLPT